MMTEAKVAQLLREFESSVKAFSYQVRGYSIWRIIRSQVGYSLQNLPLKATTGATFSSVFKIFKLLFQLIKIKSSNGVLYLVKTYSSAVREFRGGSFEDIYFESLLSSEEGGIRMVSVNAMSEPREYGRTSSSIDCSSFHAIASVLSVLCPNFRDRQVYVELSGQLESFFGPNRMSPASISRSFSVFLWEIWLYKHLFNFLSPQTVIITDSGEKLSLLRVSSLQLES